MFCGGAAGHRAGQKKSIKAALFFFFYFVKIIFSHFKIYHRVRNVRISRQVWFQIYEIFTFSQCYDTLKFCGGAAGHRAGQKKIDKDRTFFLTVCKIVKNSIFAFLHDR